MAWLSPGSVQRLAAAGLLLLPVGLFVHRAATSPDVPFVFEGAAPWIMFDSAVGAGLQQWGRPDPPRTSFRHRFDAPAPEADVAVRLRALGRFELSWNGEPVPAGRGDGSRWREETRADVTPLVRPGVNEIEVRVWNRHGPALLSLRVEGLGAPRVADAGWTVEVDGVAKPAAPADDTRVNPGVYAVESPLAALVEVRNVALGLFALGALGFLAGRRGLGPRGRARLPAAALGLAVLAWLFLFARKLREMPLIVGFDARHHLHYVDFLREHGRVPLATEGWSTYHPPLFYAAVAALVSAAEWLAGPGARELGTRLLPFAAGLAVVFVADALVRRVRPDPPARACAVVFAAVLPALLYSAAYFSNETLTTLLGGLALVLAADLLLASRTDLDRATLLALVLSLGLLTKYTGLLVAAVTGFFVLAKLVLVERARPARVAAVAGVLVGLPVALAGWFYARNVLLYGDALMANWGHMPGLHLSWWQQPGFHTAAYYTHFGDAFVHPYLSGFRSFWDSFYTTLWGDGGIGGRVVPSQRHGYWSYAFMSAGYLLALPATALLGVGALACLRDALRDPDPRRRALLSLLLTTVWAVVFSLAYTSLEAPYFAQAKASYGLVIAPVLAVFFAEGLLRCDGCLARWPWARAGLWGLVTCTAGVLFLGFAG